MGLAALVAAGSRWVPDTAYAAGPAVFAVDLAASDFSVEGGWLTTGPLPTARAFDLAGLEWDGPRPARAELRARSRAGRWSRWAPLATAGAHAPDAATAHTSEPVWFGRAGALELRMAKRPRAARLHLVDSPERGVAGAVAMARGGPGIVPRQAWNARRLLPRAAPAFGQVAVGFVHHTDTANVYGPRESAAMVLAIGLYHRNVNGWNDIGYNFLVDRYGQIFEGRAGGIQRAVIGAHAQGYNSVSTGVANLGTFNSVAQSSAGIRALARLLAWKLTSHGAPVLGATTVTSAGGPDNRYANGRPVQLNRICGHRDGDSTDCPGNVLYGQLDGVRTLSSQAAHAYSPAAPAARISVAVDVTRLAAKQKVTVFGSVPSSLTAIRLTLATRAQPAAPFRTVDVPVGAGAFSAQLRLPRRGRYRIGAAPTPAEAGTGLATAFANVDAI
jgi:hypothetical protein